MILFDAHKLDISDEFKEVLDAMKQYEEKVSWNIDVKVDAGHDNICQMAIIKIFLFWNNGLLNLRWG